MSTYNRAKLLTRSLDSLYEQDFSSFELVLVDDGSDDDTFSIVNRYLKKYKNLLYLKYSKQNYPLSLNLGIANASGEYITFLDSDDMYMSKHLSLRYNYLKKNPKIDLIYGGLIIKGNSYVEDAFDKSKLIHIDDCVTCGTLFGKKEVFEKLQGFKAMDYAHDADFVQRALKQNYEVEKVAFKTYVYFRDTPDSICNTRQKPS